MKKDLKLELRKQYYEFLDAKDRVDRDMINECVYNYDQSKIDYNGKICLDLGANIGGFVKVALDRGASHVIAVECDIRNFEKMANSFASEDRVTLIYGAISNSEESTIKLYKSNSQQNHCTTTIIKRNIFKKYDEVPNIKIQEVLKFNPEIVKIDIEGAEYQIIDDLLKYLPNILFIELHCGTVKKYTKPTIEKLHNCYPNSNIKERIVYGSISSYDCLFIK